MSESQEKKYESFLKLFRANEKQIFRFILTLLPNYSAAEDVMQDTMLVMWKKYDQYSPNTNFSAWGRQIGRFAVFQYQRNAKSGFVCFDSNAMEKIIANDANQREKEGLYSEALEECIKLLERKNRKIISLRYVDNMKISDIAAKLEKTMNATYQMMFRIHRSLLQCIERRSTRKEML